MTDTTLTLTLDSADVERVAELLKHIDNPKAMSGDPASDRFWERREYAIADLSQLLHDAMMER